ncbi:MAG: aspartate/glutamate racemase family protein, partial [Bacteroidales bacterium]|nr:aspartate/glutamate racemase family protein [Bacteroidales bacterium]
VGVLATAGTLRGSKYLKARKLHAEKVRLVEQPGKGYVEMVESGASDDETVERSLRPLLDAGADTIVLGCSHYPFLLEELKKAAKRLAPEREVIFVDSAPAVADRLVNVMKEEGITPNDGAEIELYSSGDDAVLKRLYSTTLNFA